ncbi:lamin tail domain-containing protein [Dactylosporangium sp. NPDC005572]|uniref:lamin tail domain-containing protein n=1 Tax=Dactylosporangium sp. NPDC005572 TaxID=3156889 RepID=UPI0033A8A661
MRTPRLLVAALAALTLPLLGTAAPAAAEDASGVVINEVESNGGSPGDWVELLNTGPADVDLSGWVLKDNDDTHVFTIASGTTITPGGYLALDVEVSYGLGGADSARLFRPDGTTLVDAYSWTAHATTTYGRCGTGFTTTTSSTKGAANDCSVPVRINEVESSGGAPGDWVELVNTGGAPVDVSGWVLKDNDDTHVFTIPAGTTIAGGGYLALDVEVSYGLGGADSARLFLADGVTLVDSYSWTTHATTTYGRCGAGFTTTTSPTKGAVNDCSVPVRINEVESNGGTPGDWIELANTGATPADVSGWVLKDNDDTHVFAIPAGTVLAAGGFAAFDVEVSYGLGGADSARLFLADGVTLVDSYSWTAHATTTYGRCGTGFTTTTAPTKGAANACPGQTPASPWPGGSEITTVDDANVFGGNMSGLTYQGSTLWAVKNGPGTLYRLAFDGTRWTPTLTAALHYGDGTGDLDAEGVTVTDNGVFVSTERNNANSGVSRPAIERFAVVDGASSLNATAEWNLTADLPVVGANLGLEGITFVPDAVLTAGGFVDEHTGAKYDPATYPNHGGGIFFVGVEANGTVYGYALDQAGGAFTRVATIVSGFAGVMDLQFEPETAHLWVVCDDTCQGRTATFDLDAFGRYSLTNLYERPAGMPNYNNEGFAIAPQSACVAGRKPVVYADDSNDEGHALRAGTLPCTVPDSDGDGIDDLVDTGDDTFTGGKIVNRNGRAIHVDANLTVTVGPGAEPALFQLTGSTATIALVEGAYSVKAPLATLAGGPAVVTVPVKSTPILITVAAGGSVTYTNALTGIQSAGPVAIRAASQPADACAGIAIQNVVIGGTGNEQLSGTAGNDLILGRGGNDVVAGKGGTDCITTGPGNDTITTADGADWIDAGGGNNVITAGAGDNVITAASGNDTITTGAGNDRIAAGGGNNVINAGDGANVVTTASGNDTVVTGAGDDIIDAGNGNNTINAGAGNDRIGTGSGNDTVDCGAGTDGAYVGKGNNTNAGNRCETYGV